MRFWRPVKHWLGRTRARTPLKIVFVDPTFAYTATTPLEQPLGGSQSAVCYLAEALAAAGHRPVLLNGIQTAGVSRGVEWMSRDRPASEIAKLLPDVVVGVLSALDTDNYRLLFGSRPRLVLWTQHAHDQPAVAPLRDPRVRACYNGIAVVSEWQREHFERELRVDKNQLHVLPNAIGPAFRDLFGRQERIGAAKKRPPVLAYTSTPFRGLIGLLDVFPEIRRRVPETRLQVFSSMRVYQETRSNDDAEFGALYRRCAETEGVEYIGSLPQPQLAAALRAATVLAYPNTFPETFCIAALEAMAAGCAIVTSALGALPETTAGYARLVSMVEREDLYASNFIDAVVATLEESIAHTNEALLRAQVDYANRRTWELRAREWLVWLETLTV
jgi:glycosyltransferase involved in cell wall biosynthesis